LKITGYDNLSCNIEVDDQVKVSGRKDWYKVTVLAKGTVYGCRWLNSRGRWNYDQVVRIPVGKIYCVVHPFNYGGK